jgi:hypothetical protein
MTPRFLTISLLLTANLAADFFSRTHFSIRYNQALKFVVLAPQRLGLLQMLLRRTISSSTLITADPGGPADPT